MYEENFKFLTRGLEIFWTSGLNKLLSTALVIFNVNKIVVKRHTSRHQEILDEEDILMLFMIMAEDEFNVHKHEGNLALSFRCQK